MKSKIIYVIMLAIVLSVFNVNLIAQNGCDLCGPSSGSYKNLPIGNYSATIGVGCESRGNYSFSLGYVAKSYQPNAIAMGKYVKALAPNSVVIGSGVNADESRLLTNSIPNSFMVGFNSYYPTLFVSASRDYNSTGMVGIGNVISPRAKLHIRSDVNEDAGIILEPTSSSKMAYVQLFNDKNRIMFKPDLGLSILSQNSNINFDANHVQMNAKVTIDMPDGNSDDYALSVSGGIVTTKVMVKEVSEWHDYVFDDDYELIDINYVAKYIDKNGHLPEIPSEQDVLTNGCDMVEMDGLLLKKIEELTLYTIELNDMIQRQQEVIESLLSK